MRRPVCIRIVPFSFVFPGSNHFTWPFNIAVVRPRRISILHEPGRSETNRRDGTPYVYAAQGGKHCRGAMDGAAENIFLSGSHPFYLVPLVIHYLSLQGCRER